MRPTVLLFDIDGTLLTSDRAGLRAITRAFVELHGRDDACAGFTLHGMTDRAIVRRGLTAIGVAADEARIDALLARYLERLVEEVRDANAARYFAHPGVVELVDAAVAQGLAVGLGTGNIERGAAIKLGRVRLYERFAFGGFGSDHEDRAELIRIGAERGAASLGLPRASCRVVVIGDTPQDYAAARAIGADSLLVATGIYPVAELAALRPTLAVQTLAQAAARDLVLRG